MRHTDNTPAVHAQPGQGLRPEAPWPRGIRDGLSDGRRMLRSRDPGIPAPVRTLLSLPDLTSLSLWGQRHWTQSVFPKQADSPLG